MKSHKAKAIDGTLGSLNEKQLLDLLIEHKIESQCVNPSFIINHPLVMSPLAKSHEMGRTGRNVSDSAAPFLAERFELFINKMEIANAYSEQNDAENQKKAF